MKRVLITGITGMIGKHLSKILIDDGFEVAGISRATSAARYSQAKHDYKHFAGDIMDLNFLSEVWRNWKPDLVYHLAAQAFNGESWKFEDSTYMLNILGSKNIFNTCRIHTPNARIIPACSSAEYGIVNSDLFPINEDITPLQPITPYGVSKASMEMMARQFALNYKMDFVLPRLFIHLGPDHPPVTAIQNFALQLARIKLGIQAPIIKVGNLDSSRDFVDVRDGAKALLTLAKKGKTTEVYNICSGTAYTMSESLDLLVKISKTKVTIEIDPLLFRPSDEKLLLGDPAKINKLGWSSSISFEETLLDIFNNWLVRLKNNNND